MGLITRGKIERLRGVVDRAGEFRPAANADLQEKISELLGFANDKLGNADAVFSTEIEPSTAGEALPPRSIEEGKEVLLLADPANGGIIYVGEPGSPSVPLTGGNGVTLQVTNTDVIDAQASETGQTLHLIAEESA